MGVSAPGEVTGEFDPLGAARAHDNPAAVACIEKILSKMHSECECCGCSTKKLMLCSACKKVRYCSVDCQKKDRKVHKDECKKAAAKSAP